MEIFKNPSSGRFEIVNIEEKEVRKGKEIRGINGFHGTFENFIGRVLAFFNKTVAVKGEDGTYFFNCESLKHWFNRIGVQGKLDVHNPKWVQQTIDGIVEKKVKANEELHDAIKNGEVTKCMSLIRDKKISPDGRNSDGELPLEQAIKQRNQGMVRKLVQLGANLNLEPSKASGSPTLLKFVEKTVSSQDKDAYSFLLDPENQQEIKHEFEQEEQEQKIDKERQEKELKEENLKRDFRNALWDGNLAELKSEKFKDERFAVEAYVPNPLSVTIQGTQKLKENRFAVAEYLLIKNPQLINQTDYKKISPLETAINEFDLEGVKWLISKGANTTVMSSEKKNLFEYAKDFFARSRPQGMTETHKQILLLLASTEAEKKIIEASDLETKKNQQKDDILQAIKKADDEKFKLLIDGGFDSSWYEEFLYELIRTDQAKSSELLDFFLKKSLPEKLNQEIYGKLPLEWALKNHDPKKINILIQNGAKTDLKNSANLTFEQLVKDQENPYFTKELKDKWEEEHQAILALLNPQVKDQVQKKLEGEQAQPIEEQKDVEAKAPLKPEAKISQQVAFGSAFASDNIQKAKEIIDQGIDQSLMPEFLANVIFSKKPNSLDFLNLLLEKATPEQVNKEILGRSLLEWAVLGNNSKQVQALKNKGADINPPIQGHASLYEFAKNQGEKNQPNWKENHEAILALLKPQAEEINAPPQVAPQKPDLQQQRKDFKNAFFWDNKDLAIKAINQEIDKTTMTEFLKLAISEESHLSLEILNLLLEKATSDQVNEKYLNIPLLQWAVINHDSKKVQALLNKGANTNFEIFRYDSLYDFAAAQVKKNQDQTLDEWNQNHQAILDLLKPKA